MPHPRTVSSTQLTLLMITLIVVPILSGVALYWNAPRIEEAHLPAEIKIAAVWLDESGGALPGQMETNRVLKDESNYEAGGAEVIESKSSNTSSPTAEQSNSRRLVQCIVIKNVSDIDFGKLSIGINDQFFSTGNKQLPAGQQVAVPLESFIARNGSVRFPVGNRRIHKATVFAQLGLGARGVSEYLLDYADQTGAAEWKIPQPKKSIAGN